MKTYLQFLEEAKRIKVLRTTHFTDSETAQSMLDKGLRSGTRSDGTYHDKGQNVLYTVPRNKSRTGLDYGSARVNFRVVNPKVTTIDSPKNYGSRFKNWMRNASDEDLANNTNRPIDSFKQSRSAIKSGAKVVRVPDAHGGHDQPKKGNNSSYILLNKDLANKSIDKNPPPTIRAEKKPQRTQTQPKKKPNVSEANEARPPREVLAKISRAYSKRHRGVNVDASHSDKTGDISLHNI